MDHLGGRYFSDFIPQDGTLVLYPGNYSMTALWEMEQQVFDASGGFLPVRLVVSGASCCNYSPTSDFYDRIARRNYQGLKAYKLPPYSEGHVEMLVPSFRDSIAILFSQSK